MPSVSRAASPPSPAATLGEYCATCHNQRLKTGGLSLDALDPANVGHDAETWEKGAGRALLGLDVDVGSLLPPDDAAYGFDNVAGRARQLACTAAGLSRGGAEDQHRGGRRRAYRRRQRHLLGHAGFNRQRL